MQYLNARLRFVDRTSREEIHAHDLELGRGQRAGEYRPAIPGYRSGKDLALLEQGRDQTERLSAMFGAFDHREDARVRGLHVVVDHDAAPYLEPGRAAQFDVR